MTRLHDQAAVDRAREELQTIYKIKLPPFEIGAGWLPLVEAFLEEAARRGELEPLDVSEIKEKWGCLRISHGGSPELDRVSDELEARSAHICMFCGDPGQLRTTGWHVTSCDSCEAAVRGRKKR